MAISFLYHSDLEIEVPIKSDGHVHEVFFNFLFTKKNSLNLFSKAVKKPTPITIHNIAYKVKYLIDTFEENGIEVYQASFEDIKSIMEFMHDNGFSGESIQTYTTAWRQYYEFIDKSNIYNEMSFPEQTHFDKRTDKESDFLSHTSHRTEKRIKDNTVPDEWLTDKATYAKEVLTMNEFWSLYKALDNLDRVYAVMAFTMLQTFLRIGGIVQFPKIANAMNPSWKSYDSLKQLNKSSQELTFINKGGKRNSCLVTTKTLQFIQEQYLECEDLDYEQRRKLLISNYIPSSFCKKTEIGKYPPLWLNKNGTPVSVSELQGAFRKASSVIGRKVKPHYMRHTGATHLLMNYELATGIKLNMSLLSDVHTWLSMQLCHNQFKTTARYIKTVMKLKGDASVLALLPEAFSSKDLKVATEVKEVYEKIMQEHLVFFTELRP